MLMIKAILMLLLIEQIAGTQLNNRSPPLFTNQHPNVYTFETDENGNRQDLILPCPIDNPSPTVNYTWFRENRELPGSMVNGEGSLVISNITEGEYASREGVDYYCIARDNIVYSVAIRSRTITVYYAYFNGFERMASTVEVSVPVALNSDVALKCDVLDANPPPQIKWFDDQGEIQEMRLSNSVRFLDCGRYLYLRNLQATHLVRRYHCVITNANLSQEISAPTRYMLTDNLTQGMLIDYKQIGDLRAFVGNASYEFSYVGGVFGDNVNGTANRLFVNNSPVDVLGNIGSIERISSPGDFILNADVNYNGIVTRRNGTLTVNQVPRITKKSSLQNTKRNHFVGEANLIYTCGFEGYPFPNIVFYFNGAPITATNGVNVVNDTLTIPSPQVNHSGIYQCIVSNELGDDQAAWLLEVRRPILPQVQPYNFTKLNAFDDRDLGALFVRPSGNALSFSIDVVADPCPSIEWTLNDTQLEVSDVIMFNNPCGEPRSLNWIFMLNVTVTQATSGSYSAKLNNTAGITQLPNVYFTIPEPVSVTGLTLNETCLKEGSNVAVRCNVRGFPRPMIQLLLNDEIITPGVGEFKNYVMEFYDQIAVMNVTMSAGGRYMCIATSASSPPLQDTQSFAFCKEPVITDVNFTPNPRIDESFFIECIFDGIPIPESVVWRKDGDELSEMDNNIKIVPTANSSHFEITKATITDNGIYECNISNVAGYTSRSFQIELQPAIIPRNQLSPGVIAGIVVGVVIFILLVVIPCIILTIVLGFCCNLCCNIHTYKVKKKL